MGPHTHTPTRHKTHNTKHDSHTHSLSLSFSEPPLSLQESDYHAAFQRLDSLSSSVDASMTNREALAADPGDALNTRRRRSLRMMESMSLNSSCKDAIYEVLMSFNGISKDGNLRRRGHGSHSGSY